MKYSKFNIVYHLQKWMDSVAGQTFLNYAYSWGASIVILGTLFKLTHLPGANTFLFLGMGTEVFVFFISAFDRPFDKTADGMELAHPSQQMENAMPAYRQHVTIMDETLSQADIISQHLPDTAECEEMKKTLAAIHEIYKVHLAKAGRQIASIEDINQNMADISSNLAKLNGIYGRMLQVTRQDVI